MTDRPILFSGPMVRALLEGRKTQTRRIAKHQPVFANATFGGFYRAGTNDAPLQFRLGNRDEILTQRTKYEVGDRLWVRDSAKRSPDLWVYTADGSEVQWPGRRDLAGRVHNHCPSIHMPRTASRLTLVVTDVRVERVQDISEEDAKAEGLSWVSPTWGVPGLPDSWWSDPRQSFRALWDSLNKQRGYGWEVNPWVVAVTFDVHKCNIEAMP